MIRATLARNWELLKAIWLSLLVGIAIGIEAAHIVRYGAW